MANPWDVGSARLLAHAGFPALATTSSGFAASRGRDDYGVTRDELVTHVAALAEAVSVPLNVDAEGCFPFAPGGVAETVRMLHDAGAAGCSIEDWSEERDGLLELGEATDAVAAAAEAARAANDDRLVLTARCEHLLHGRNDLDEVIERLVAYRDAGADCLYAPGLGTLEQVRAVVDAVEAPVNVLGVLVDASVAELGDAGVRRVSAGGALAWVAYGAAMQSARALLDTGRLGPSAWLSAADRAAFD